MCGVRALTIVAGEANTRTCIVGDKSVDLTMHQTCSWSWQQVTIWSFSLTLEAQLKIGTHWTPKMTLVVLRVGEEEIACNSLPQALRAGKKTYHEDLEWKFETGTEYWSTFG